MWWIENCPTDVLTVLLRSSETTKTDAGICSIISWRARADHVETYAGNGAVRYGATANGATLGSMAHRPARRRRTNPARSAARRRWLALLVEVAKRAAASRVSITG